MTLKCIINLGDIKDISADITKGCYAINLCIWSQNEKVMIYKTNNNLDSAIFLFNNLPIFTEIKGVLCKEMEAYIIINRLFLHIASEDKELIRNLHISNNSLTLGLIEPKNTHLKISELDFFVSYIIINYNTTTREKVLAFREKLPDVSIYIRDVSNIQHTKNCIMWKVDGIITHTNKLVTKYNRFFTCV